MVEGARGDALLSVAAQTEGEIVVAVGFAQKLSCWRSVAALR